MKPISSAATRPVTTQITDSFFRSNVFRASIPSIIMLLPRETSSAIRPQDKALATADESETRQAMFENGTSFVNSQV